MKTIFPMLVVILLASLGQTDSFAAGAVKERVISVNGVERTYSVHMPAKFDRSKKLPAVIALKGEKNMLKVTRGGLNRLADSNGFIVVYPKPMFTWNDGRPRMAKKSGNADDTGFILALINRLVSDNSADPKRIYLTGLSEGGQMALRMACEHADRIAAIAPVAASFVESSTSHCKPARPIPVLVINGMNDPRLPWQGGPWKISFRAAAMYERFLSAESAIRFWARNNKCEGAPLTEILPDKNAKDGTRVQKATYSRCADGADVILYGVKGGGHTWPGGYQYEREEFIGKTSKNIDANVVIWEFFKRHELK
jgi:polyhydroxybutyrate depolymerase